MDYYGVWGNKQNKKKQYYEKCSPSVLEQWSFFLWADQLDFDLKFNAGCLVSYLDFSSL